jgi:hypothetical protein
VSHQHDGGATGGERPHRGEKAHSLLVGEDRRRLVEDEDAGARQQHLDDLDPLPLRNRQFVDAAAGIDRKAELGGLGRDLSLDLAKTRRETPAPIGEQHVFGDGERLHQLEFLVHHSDAASHRIARAGEHDLFAVNEEPPGLRGVEAGGHVHQRRFAGAVLAQERVDLAGVGREIGVVEGKKSVERLPDPNEFQGRDHFDPSSRRGRGRAINAAASPTRGHFF